MSSRNHALALKILNELARVMYIYGDKGRHVKHTIFDGYTGKTKKVYELRVERRKTIFAQFKDNDKLKKALELFAIELGLIIYWGRAGYPDIIAIPSAAIIVDKGVIDDRSWNSFLEFRKVDRKSPCFIVTEKIIFRRHLRNIYEFRINDAQTPQKLIDKLRRYFNTHHLSRQSIKPQQKGGAGRNICRGVPPR